MRLEHIGGSAIEKLNKNLQEDCSEAIQPSTSFMDYLKGAMGEANQLQKVASAQAEGLAMGEGYLHNTFIAYEKANLSFQLMVEVRNKVVEAYQEIMRMQV